MSFFERIFGGGDRQPVEPIVVLGLPIALPVQQILDSLYPLLLFVNQVSVGLAVALLVALALCGCAQFIGGFIGAFKERRSSCGPRSVSPSTMGPVSGNSVSTDSSTRWTTPSKAAAMTVPESMRERLAAALDGMKQTSSKRSNEKSSGSVRRPGILSSSSRQQSAEQRQGQKKRLIYADLKDMFVVSRVLLLMHGIQLQTSNETQRPKSKVE